MKIPKIFRTRLIILTPKTDTKVRIILNLRTFQLQFKIQHLSQDEGVNLAGIKRILELTQRVNELEEEVEQLENTLDLVRKQQRNSRALVHVPRSQAVVVWTPEVRQRGQ